MDTRGALAVLGRVRRAAKASGRTFTEAALAAEWRLVTVAKKEGEKPIEQAARREFRREQAQVLSNLQRITASLVFDIDGWASDMAGEIGPPALAALRAGFEAGAARVGVVDALPFRVDDPRVRIPLRALLGKTKDIADTTADALTRQIMQGVGAGETQAELAARVRAVFSQATGYRSRLIARTSATTATEAGSDFAFREAGIGRRSWLSQRAGNTRAAHLEADGQEVGIDEPFIVDGYAMQYPGDYSAPVHLVANCYCTVLPLL